MTDTTAGDRLQVSTDGGAGPYIYLLESRLPEVTRALDAASIPYWADEESLSVDGRPYVTWINFPRSVDPAAVQAVLDRLS
jgi:hypothetical protein